MKTKSYAIVESVFGTLTYLWVFAYKRLQETAKY